MSERIPCAARVWQHHTFYPCAKAGKIERDGKWYCGIHDPERRKKRDEERHARIMAEMEENRRQWERKSIERSLIELALKEPETFPVIAQRLIKRIRALSAPAPRAPETEDAAHPHPNADE